MIDAFDVDLFSKAVAAFIAGSQLPVELRWHCVVAIQIYVAADAEMLGPDQLRHVIEMIQHVLDRGRLISLDEHTHAGYAHNAAGGSHLFDCFVGLAAWMPRHKSAAV